MAGSRIVPLQDDHSVSTAHVVCDLRGVAFIVHKEQLEFPDIIHQKLLEAIGKKVARLLVTAIPDLCQVVNTHMWNRAH
jgi:hypothetical protein